MERFLKSEPQSNLRHLNRYAWLVDEEFSTSMSVPLDSDGFLRRECPTCEREFKWLPASDDAEEDQETPSASENGYYCPYCKAQASPDAWFTKAQIEQAKAVLTREFVEPELMKFKETTEQSAAGGFLDISVDVDTPDDPPSLTEPDDMRRIDFPCHSQEPVKVLEDWSEPVHCMICGAAVPSSA